MSNDLIETRITRPIEQNIKMIMAIMVKRMRILNVVSEKYFKKGLDLADGFCYFAAGRIIEMIRFEQSA
jgi:hypothetical protein